MARNQFPEHLLRQTLDQAAEERNGEPVDDLMDAGDDAEGRGERPPKPARKRPGRAASVPKGKDHKLAISDDVFRRLQYCAIDRRKTMSFIADQILNRHLPRFKVTKDDKAGAEE